jgi:hypothetical protein
MIATCINFALCLPYLPFFPFTPLRTVCPAFWLEENAHGEVEVPADHLWGTQT